MGCGERNDSGDYRETLNQIILNELSTGFLLSSLLWVKEEEPENYERIEKVVVSKDYIRYKMCGEIAMDYSDASGTLVYDTAKNIWAWELIDELGLERGMFPECHESAEIAGKVTAKCAEETGLREGTPIVYGGGDSIMQQVGNGVIDEKSPWIANIGTSCSLNCASSQPVYDHWYRVNTFSHTRDHVWMIMGAGLGVTDRETLAECIRAGKENHKKTVVDMICVEDTKATVEYLEDLGVEVIAVHTGVDQQVNGRTPLDDLKELKKYCKKAQIAVAGGINRETLAEYLECNPDIVIVGGGVFGKEDPAAEAERLYSQL